MKRLLTYLKPHIWTMTCATLLVLLIIAVELYRPIIIGDAIDQYINNPALTGQVLVSCARAACKQRPGCYTMIDIPPIDFLAGSSRELIARLV